MERLAAPERGVVDEPANQEKLGLQGREVKSPSDHGDCGGVPASVVGEQSREALRKQLTKKPLVQPEGRGAAVHHLHPCDDAVEGDARLNDLLLE
jgi:uroporphyrinogen-III synthase